MAGTENLFVSIVMPVFNRQHTVKNAMKSVLQQTYPHFEFIIVDDASTDRTSEIIQSFSDDRLRYIKCPTNVGAAAARNIGIQQSRGNWIAFQDSDDLWMPDKLEKQINLVQEKGQIASPIIFTSFYRHKKGKTESIPNTHRTIHQGDIHKELLLGNFISTQTVLLHKACLEDMGGFAEDMPRFQDWELWLRLSLEYPFYWIKEPLVDVYYSEDSISSSQDKLIHAYEKILMKHKPLFKKAGPKYMASFLFSYGHNLCLAGKMNKGRSILLQALKCQWNLARGWIAFISSIFGNRLYKKIYFYYNNGLE